MTQSKTNLITSLQSSFIKYGWLVPAVFPVANIGGRGLFNSLFFLYILWGLVAIPRLPRSDLVLAGKIIAILGCAYAPSIFLAIDTGRALKSWFTVILYMATAALTYGALQRSPDSLHRLLTALGFGAIAALAAGYIDLIKNLLTNAQFVPRIHLRAVDLAIFFPFMLALAARREPSPSFPFVTAALYVLTAGFVIFSDERAVLTGFVAASALLALFALRFSILRALGVGIVLVTVALVLNYESVLRGPVDSGTLFQQLDSFSSGRLTLWSQALQHPPENLLFGVGMGNARYYEDVLRIGDEVVRHLHNLWFDAWYETGVLGVSTLLAVLFVALATMLPALGKLQGRPRQQAALFLAAFFSVLIQSQFSVSYASREFNIYGMLCLAVIAHILCQARCDARAGGTSAER